MAGVTISLFFAMTYNHLVAEIFGHDFFPHQHSHAYKLLPEPERSYYEHFDHVVHREHNFIEFMNTLKHMREK